MATVQQHQGTAMAKYSPGHTASVAVHHLELLLPFERVRHKALMD